MPQMVTKTSKPTTPQMSKFLLSFISFSLPADFIKRATPQTKAKKATAPKNGITLNPIFVNKLMISVKFVGVGILVC